MEQNDFVQKFTVKLFEDNESMADFVMGNNIAKEDLLDMKTYLEGENNNTVAIFKGHIKQESTNKYNKHKKY